jgi:type IV pilus assembly protein PilB
MKRLPLGQILVEDGAIDRRQLRVGLEWQKRWNCRLGHALVHLGFAPEMVVLRALARQFHLPVVDLAGWDVDPEVLRLVPVRVQEQHALLPLELRRETRRGPLLVATSDPLDAAGLDAATFASGKIVRPVLACRSQIEVAIRRHQGRIRPEALDLPPEPDGEMDLVRPIVHQRRLWN